MRIRKFIVLAIAFLLASYSVQATHLRAGEITIQRESCTSLTFIITITVYTNTGSEIKFGDGVLDFGDNSTPFITPTVDNTKRPDLGPNVGIVIYSTTHTYSGPGRYIVSYLEPNRNAGILNMFNSVDTRFYLESTINIDPFLGCDNSPRLLVPPIDRACTGAAWYHNPGAYDPDGDSLSYEFTIPKRDKGLEVNNYRNPNVKEFYDRVGINYSTANESGNGPPTFNIDAVTGTIVWDAPGAPGEYNIAFIIKEWRKISGIWINQGYVVRDMQIVVEDCKNKRPELQVPPDICVEAGTKITAQIFGTDPDVFTPTTPPFIPKYDSVKIEAFSQILNQDLSHPFPSPATYVPVPPKFQAQGPAHIAKVDFTWQTTCNHIKEQPYQVVFKITDKPQPNKGSKLVQFKTWNIRVVAPAPTWKDTHLIPSSRKIYLEWNPYACVNASTIQIWRRVESFPYTQVACVTGIPDNLGFTKIKEVPASDVKYTDSGLSVGAQYCYRLVAVFPAPGGGKSYVSAESCLPPIKIDAPVVTNVTVDKTSTTAGKITIKWRSGFEADKVQFPRPFGFKVYRAEGFTGINKIFSPHTGILTDSTYTDTNVNTEEATFNYRIAQYFNSNTLMDTSVTASSVRLEAKPQFKQIELNWAASVPWSNQSQSFPNHLIYRGKPGDTESQLVLIDSVNTTSGKFTYLDDGHFNNTPLLETQVYCYRVMTKGSYGNAKIKAPLLNYSEIICAQPNDEKPPCKQELAIIATPCDQYISTQPCDPLVFSNTVTWKRPTDEACRQDIKSYNIYVAGQKGGEFGLYTTNVKDTFYIDSNLPSFARCYKVSAVDRAGNESELSDQYCFDNCPHYELPNVFTPNGDNCNELFSAYSNRQAVDENGNGPCGPVDETKIKLKCARFVENVKFVVINRWGKDVYTYQSGGERSIYIDWDGKDDNGKDLVAGVYYYNAEVTFTVVDPSQKTRNIHGWVQIVR